MFIDHNSDIDKEALRQFVLKELGQLKLAYSETILGQSQTVFWNNLHDAIVTKIGNNQELDKALVLEGQIHNLPAYIDQWIQTAVDSTERFDFFISAKAEEIKSGDTMHDYFWALQIRHDQLTALVRVLSRLYNEITQWLLLEPSAVIDSPIFQGLLDYSIEAQIYLEAENIQRLRNQQTQPQ